MQKIEKPPLPEYTKSYIKTRIHKALLNSVIIQPGLKMGKIFDQTTKNIIVNKHIWYSTWLIIRKHKLKITVRKYYLDIWMTPIKKTNKQTKQHQMQSWIQSNWNPYMFLVEI